jgi:predicted CoA-binding protein
MTTAFTNPPRESIDRLLRATRTIAVIGISDDPLRPSWDVSQRMRGYGYRIVPINPQLGQWEGIPAHATLEAAVAALGPGERIDLVNVFRRPALVGEVVDDCIRLDLPALWLQLGVVNEPAALRAVNAGLTVVMDRCIYVDRAAWAS